MACQAANRSSAGRNRTRNCSRRTAAAGVTATGAATGTGDESNLGVPVEQICRRSRRRAFFSKSVLLPRYRDLQSGDLQSLQLLNHLQMVRRLHVNGNWAPPSTFFAPLRILKCMSSLTYPQAEPPRRPLRCRACPDAEEHGLNHFFADPLPDHRFWTTTSVRTIRSSTRTRSTPSSGTGSSIPDPFMATFLPAISGTGSRPGS